MKTTIQINGEPVEITLTKDQIAAIKKASISIFDRLKTFQDALDLTGETREDFNKRTEHDDDQEKAGKELSVIFKAIREGKKGGYYYPYFNNPNHSGSGFSFGGYHCDHDHSTVGSRHTADTAEKATYVGKQFTPIFNRYING